MPAVENSESPSPVEVPEAAPQEVEVLADSFTPGYGRVLTFRLRYQRFIHAEFMTHRNFSRNAGSSRARPIERVIQQVTEADARPSYWGMNKPGMQAGEEFDNPDLARHIWRKAVDYAVFIAQWLDAHGLHKQVVNRILEPFQMIDVVVTMHQDGLVNFLWLRDEEHAQPEIQELARSMRDAANDSTPTYLKGGEWHLPYITDADRKAVIEQMCHLTPEFKRGLNAMRSLLAQLWHPVIPDSDLCLCAMSAARCARVSYRNFDGTGATPVRDLDMVVGKLLGGDRVHASPFEHQATPATHALSALPVPVSNLGRGWLQFRKTINGEAVRDPAAVGLEPAPGTAYTE